MRPGITVLTRFPQRGGLFVGIRNCSLCALSANTAQQVNTRRNGPILSHPFRGSATHRSTQRPPQENQHTTMVAEGITIRQPDDFHLHIRDGDLMKFVLPFTTSVFGKAIIMPNTTPPIKTTEDARKYRERITEVLESSGHTSFTPLMTLYLTDSTEPEEIQRAKDSGFVFGVKLYPAGATTNSDNGVTDMTKVEPTLRMMEKLGMPLLIHGEVVEVDIFDREAAFITEKLQPLLENFPDLRVVVEHATTKEMVEFVENSTHKKIGATITPHHLLFSRNEFFMPPDKPGTAFNPHLFCLPVLKAEEHRKALVRAATSGNPRFFAGTDSAPHLRKSKECSCCAAGVFCAPNALEGYATAFDRAGALDKLEAFVSEFGSDFYGLPRNTRRVSLKPQPLAVPAAYNMFKDNSPANDLVPMSAGKTLPWSIASVQE